nr:hypothetical protein [Colwellia sp.]
KVALNIPDDILKSTVNERYLYVNKKAIANFTPYIRVIWTRRPSPLIAAQPFPHLYKIAVTESLLKLPIKEQLRQVCNLYKQHQLQHYACKFNLTNSKDSYLELVSIIESKIKNDIDIGWSIGNGFIYHKTVNESYEFNRLCKEV